MDDDRTDTTSQLAHFAKLLSGFAPTLLDKLDEFYAPDIRFQDPINTAHGLPALRAVYEDTFRQLKNIHIDVRRTAAGKSHGFVEWTMDYHFRRRPRTIAGASRVTFNDDSKVLEQRDFWDASYSVYGEFPLMTPMIKLIHRIVRVKPIKE